MDDELCRELFDDVVHETLYGFPQNKKYAGTSLDEVIDQYPNHEATLQVVHGGIIQDLHAKFCAFSEYGSGTKLSWYKLDDNLVTLRFWPRPIEED